MFADVVNWPDPVFVNAVSPLITPEIVELPEFVTVKSPLTLTAPAVNWLAVTDKLFIKVLVVVVVVVKFR